MTAADYHPPAVSPAADVRSREPAWVAWMGLALLSLAAVWWRWHNLNPPALWLDDCWQAVLSEQSFGTQFRWRSSAPIGFTWLLGVVARLSGDPEVRYQLLPFICGVALVPAAFWAFPKRRAADRAGALVFAGWLALCPPLVVYSTRVKQFTLDALLVTLLLGAALRVRTTARHLPWYGLLALAALPFSFCSALFATIFLNLATLSHVLRTRRAGTRPHVAVAGTWAVYHVALGLYYLLVLRAQKNTALVDYWADCYVKSPADVATRLATLMAEVVPWTTGDGGVWQALAATAVLLLAGGGVYRRVRQAGQREAVLAAALLYLALVVLAALRMYPLGAGRVDIHVHPVTVFLVVSALWLHPWPAVRRRWLAPALTGGATAAMLALGTLLHGGAPSTYPAVGDRGRMAAALHAAYREGDTVVVRPHGCFVFGYYTRWPYELVHAPYYATTFEIQPGPAAMHVLPGIPGYRRNPARLDPALDDILAGRPRRLLLWAAGHRVSRHLNSRMLAAGYHGRGLFRDTKCLLVEYTLNAAVPRAGGSDRAPASRPLP